MQIRPSARLQVQEPGPREGTVKNQGVDGEKRRRTQSSTSKRTETNTGPPLDQIVHLSGSNLVQLLDLSSPLQVRVSKRACCRLGSELKAGNHRSGGSSRDDH